MIRTPWKNRMQSDRPRAKRDFYETPMGLALAALNNFKMSTMLTTQLNVLDAGCGRGVWGNAARRVFGEEIRLVGVDLAISFDDVANYDDCIEADFLTYESPEIFDLVIGNPPYALGEKFIRQALDLLSDNGHIVYLLPLNFLGSKKRGDGLFAEFPHRHIDVLTRRPSFFSSNGTSHTTDALTYAIYHWDKRWLDHRYEALINQPIQRWLDWDYTE